MPDPNYDYGLPVIEDGGGGDAPADTTGDVITDPGESPHDPPPDAATIIEPGGSPSEEMVGLHGPTIASVSPNTAVVGGASLTAQVTGTNFTANTVVTVDGVDQPTTFGDATTVSYDVDPAVAAEGVVAVGAHNSGYPAPTTVPFTFTAVGGDDAKASQRRR